MPRLMTTGPLTGDNAVSVPIAPRADLAPDPVARAKFLVHFALNQLEDLPSIEEFDEFIGVLQGGEAPRSAPEDE